jgi:hypothetical protein
MIRRGQIAALLLLPLAACAQWRPWTNVATAVEDVVEATRERLESTFEQTVVSTQLISRCIAGAVVTNIPLVLTSRVYSVHAGSAASGVGGPGEFAYGEPVAVDGPIMWFWTGQQLQSTNLIPAGQQTNVWTNAAGQVQAFTAALFRSDGLWVQTNRYTCAIATNATTYLWFTSAPPAWLSWTFLDTVDQAIDEMMESRSFVDHSRAGTDGTFNAWFATPVGSNWTWSGSAWESSPVYTSDFPRLDRARVWALAGIGRTVTNVSVEDRGALFPTITTSSVQGWVAGELGSEFVEVVSTNARYLTTTNLQHLYTYAAASSNVVLHSLVSGRSPAADADPDALCESRGFGGALDRLWPTPGAAAAVAFSNAGWTLSSASAGGTLPFGCWQSGTNWAEVVFPARWIAITGASFATVARLPRSAPDLVVWRTSTNDVECAAVTNEPDAFAMPFEVQIAGRSWSPATATSSLQLVTITQTLTVATTGTVALAWPFVAVDQITASNAVLDSSVYAPAAGLQFVVRYSNAAPSFWTRLSPWAATNALGERRAVLQLLRWTAQDVALWTNIQRGVASFSTNQGTYTATAHLEGSGPGPQGCTSTVGAAFTPADCEPSWPALSATTAVSSTWLSWQQDCLQGSSSRRYDGVYWPDLLGTPLSGFTLVESETNTVTWSTVRQTADAGARFTDRIGADVDRYEAWTMATVQTFSASGLSVDLSCPSTAPWACVENFPDWFCQGELTSVASECGVFSISGAAITESFGSSIWSTNVVYGDAHARLARVATSEHVTGTNLLLFAVAPTVTPVTVTQGTNWTDSADCDYSRHYGDAGEYDEEATGAIVWEYSTTRTQAAIDVTDLQTLFLARWRFRYSQ